MGLDHINLTLRQSLLRFNLSHPLARAQKRTVVAQRHRSLLSVFTCRRQEGSLNQRSVSLSAPSRLASVHFVKGSCYELDSRFSVPNSQCCLARPATADMTVTPHHRRGAASSTTWQSARRRLRRTPSTAVAAPSIHGFYPLLAPSGLSICRSVYRQPAVSLLVSIVDIGYRLYATKRGERFRIRGVTGVCHVTPQCSSSRSR